ncbi:MAG: N-acetylglucosamine-6-phosphate deacetylase [Verrucomicrobia bacterium]|nr:MAG: N-acetylglucosamine-6-phosphate deacetylase [Verrucomicrobiota bacterium]
MPAHLDAIDNRTGSPVRLTHENGIIVSLEPIEADPSLLPRLLPPLLDIQVNGYAGVDFQGDSAGIEELETAARGLADAACSRFLLTVVTDRFDRMLSRIDRYRAARTESELLSRRIAGWHLEGPFMSPLPGFVGAHPAEFMEPPSPARIREIKAHTGDDPVLLTIAPEWPGSPDAIREARTLGFRVWLGHSDASPEQLAEAVAAGAEGFTHLSNGCPSELHRHDNIVFRVMDQPGLRASLIPDRIHISPLLFRILNRALGPDRICYTTDCMSAAGSGPGTYKLARFTLEVGEDGIVRQPGESNYAGSSLAPLEGVKRAAQMLDHPIHEVWPFFSDQPARFVGLPRGLEPRTPADYCLLFTGTEPRVEIHFAGDPDRTVRL